MATTQHCPTPRKRWTLLRAIPATMPLILCCTANSLAQKADEADPFDPERQAREATYVEETRAKPVDDKLPGVIFEGRLILYGRKVSPPLLFRISDGSLSVNGVSIDPPIAPPWKQRRTSIPVSEKAAFISELTKRVRELHRGLPRTADPNDLAAQLVRLIYAREPAVESAEWSGEDVLHLVLTDRTEFSISFDNRSSGNSRQSPAYRLEILNAQKRRFEQSLAAGDLVVIGFGPVLTVPSAEAADAEASIRTGLLHGSQDELLKALLHEELVRELLFARDNH